MLRRGSGGEPCDQFDFANRFTHNEVNVVICRRALVSLSRERSEWALMR